MTIQKSILAIIPARGGSKRLPNKNIKKLAGKELIGWTIEAAKESGLIDEIVVSTDSEEIAEISKKYGANVPFLRPNELSSDTSTTFSVIEHCLAFYKEKKNTEFKYIILLQPTSPLRASSDITASIELLRKKEAKAIISVCENDHSPLWSNTLDESLDMAGFISDDILTTRSQDLPTYYRLNGAIYLCETSELLEKKTYFLKEDIFAYVMDKKRSVDIDTLFDFQLAEAMLKLK